MLTGNNISFLRGGRPLFSGLSFSLQQGELLAIKGANGSGKSTFLRLLTGLTLPKENTLFWKGEVLSKTNLCFYQQNLLYVGHKLCLHPEARVSDQIQFWKNLYKIPEKDIETALIKWGLSAFKHKKIAHLSQGQQKRLSLSRCSWLKRSLWILDEPEAGLDQEGQVGLTDIFSYHLKRGGMIVQATHQNSTASPRALEKGVAIQEAIKKLDCDIPPPSRGFLAAFAPAKAGDDRVLEAYSHSVREIFL